MPLRHSTAAPPLARRRARRTRPRASPAATSTTTRSPSRRTSMPRAATRADEPGEPGVAHDDVAPAAEHEEPSPPASASRTASTTSALARDRPLRRDPADAKRRERRERNVGAREPGDRGDYRADAAPPNRPAPAGDCRVAPRAPNARPRGAARRGEDDARAARAARRRAGGPRRDRRARAAAAGRADGRAARGRGARRDASAGPSATRCASRTSPARGRASAS